MGGSTSPPAIVAAAGVDPTLLTDVNAGGGVYLPSVAAVADLGPVAAAARPGPGPVW